MRWFLAGLSFGLLISTVSATQQEAFLAMFLFLLPAIILLVLPFVILYALVRLLPPWLDEPEAGRSH